MLTLAQIKAAGPQLRRLKWNQRKAKSILSSWVFLFFVKNPQTLPSPPIQEVNITLPSSQQAPISTSSPVPSPSALLYHPCYRLQPCYYPFPTTVSCRGLRVGLLRFCIRLSVSISI
ncbi:hypothetical protein L207DRAFT_131570 [Hyaloscypha variabilis F]|uniref:Uncharacterized protein n=1 Tax=Hyaloscypha variabilis (strain UAMH 11265 / GT02V1 / F) TaxID=1149755 RepID=A0A2J6R985_HYAVF|nr:hypothetical protein L207DRAFT_131570 [Hyaloscypha variabilis F]